MQLTGARFIENACTPTSIETLVADSLCDADNGLFSRFLFALAIRGAFLDSKSRNFLPSGDKKWNS